MAAPAPLSEECAVVEAPEEVDLSNADDLRGQLLDALATAPRGLILDMSNTTFCDSTGLNAVLAAQHRADEVGAQLRLVTTHRSVLKILRVTGLHTVFAVRSTMEEAVSDIPC